MPDDVRQRDSADAVATHGEPLAAIVADLVADTAITDAAGLALRLDRARRQPCSADVPLVCAGEALQLDGAEFLACALAVAAAVDARVSRRLAVMQGDGSVAGSSTATAGFVAHLACGLGLARDSSATVLRLLGGTAIAAGLLIVDKPARGADAELTLAEPMLAALSGAELRCARFGATTLAPLAVPGWHLPRALAEAVAAHAHWLGHTPDALLVIRASSAEEARRFAALVAATAGAPAVGAESSTAEPIPPSVQAWLAATGAIPVLSASGGTIALPAFNVLHWPVALAAGRDDDVPGGDRPRRDWNLELPDLSQRLELWQELRDRSEVDSDARWLELARHARLSYATLLDVRAAATRAAGRPNLEDLRRLLNLERARQAQRLAPLAQLIATAGVLDAFVAPPALADALTLLAERCAAREELPAQLGPAFGARHAAGVKALLTGASGTGKTLAAQWLAARLDRPLLRVDLAAVTSKYIGETEKHLAHLLARAETIDAVLLFDEADALFGARTDIRQSTDRYANAQTNYLLTRLESFHGVALLTANNATRFDSAFMRRLDAVVEFPLPAADERRRLWDLHLGAAQRLDAHARNRLAAEIDFTGGQIRNAVLGALLIARSQGRSQIGWPDLLHACGTELAKHGRSVPTGLADAAAVPAASALDRSPRTAN